MDSESGEVDGVGCGGGGIGAGGRRNNKGVNIDKQEAANKRKARLNLPQQNDVPHPPPLRVFADGSQLLFDWRRTHPALLCRIICQATDICWALVLGVILQFGYNKDRGDSNQYKEFDVDGFAKKVKFGDKVCEPLQKVGASSMAIGSLKVAMDHVRSVGMEKKKDTLKTKRTTFKLKGSFLPLKNATPESITGLMETKGPMGLTLDLTAPLSNLTDGIYRVPKPIDGIKRHVVTILAHGLTETGEIFFEVQNTWGIDWGVEGYGRIIISGTTDDVFYLDEIFEQKKKK